MAHVFGCSGDDAHVWLIIVAAVVSDMVIFAPRGGGWRYSAVVMVRFK